MRPLGARCSCFFRFRRLPTFVFPSSYVSIIVLRPLGLLVVQLQGLRYSNALLRFLYEALEETKGGKKALALKSSLGNFHLRNLGQDGGGSEYTN